MLSLEGKSAIITGAGSGIGRAVSLKMAQQGATVGINDINEAKVEETIDVLKSYGLEKYYPLVGDVTDYQGVNELVERFYEKFNKIDVLVNNAGFITKSKIYEMSRDTWHRTIDVMLNGTFNWSRAVTPYMVAQNKGKIVNSSSSFALVGAPTCSHYSAAKCGVIGFTKSLAKELAPYNINVNAVAPGTVSTDLHGWTEEEKKRRGEQN